MDVDFAEFITAAPPGAAAGGSGGGNAAASGSGGGGDVDDLIAQLSRPPPSTSAPPPPPSIYRPPTEPSYGPPAAQFAAAARAPPPPASSVAATQQSGAAGGGWWSGLTSLFGGGSSSGSSSSSKPSWTAPSLPLAAHGALHDSAIAMRKRKRKLLRDMRRMLEADAAARVRAAELVGAEVNESDVYQMRSTESSSLEEVEEEHDLVLEEHNERVGMDTARTTFVSAIGQLEAFNDEWKPFGSGVQLQGFEESVKSNLGDYEADIQAIRESVVGLGLPQWCFTAARLGVAASVLVAVNRKIQDMVASGDLDASIAYHPKVREAMREATAQHLAEAARRDGGGGGVPMPGPPRAGPGPPMYVNNKPRMPDTDARPGDHQRGAATFMVQQAAAQQQQQQQQAGLFFQPPEYTHDPYAYVPPTSHSGAAPIVNVPLPPQLHSASQRDVPGDRAAYAAQQAAFAAARRAPDLAPPAAFGFSGAPSFTMRFAPAAPPVAVFGGQPQQQPQHQQPPRGGGEAMGGSPPEEVGEEEEGGVVEVEVLDEFETGGEEEDGGAVLGEDGDNNVGTKRRMDDEEGGGGDAQSVSSRTTGGGANKRRRRGKKQQLEEDDLLLMF